MIKFDVFILHNQRKLSYKSQVFKRCEIFSDHLKEPIDDQKNGKVKQEPAIRLSSKTCRKAFKAIHNNK